MADEENEEAENAEKENKKSCLSKLAFKRNKTTKSKLWENVWEKQWCKMVRNLQVTYLVLEQLECYFESVNCFGTISSTSQMSSKIEHNNALDIPIQ